MDKASPSEAMLPSHSSRIPPALCDAKLALTLLQSPGRLVKVEPVYDVD